MSDNEKYRYGFKFLSPLGGTNEGDKSREFYYRLPYQGQKWSDWTMHPTPAKPDGADCGYGRLHVMLKPSSMYAPPYGQIWFARWRPDMELGRSQEKAGVTGLQLRRIKTATLARLIRYGFFLKAYGLNAELNNLRLNDIDLRKSNMRFLISWYSNFSSSRLTGAILMSADMRYCIFNSANMQGVVGFRANFTRASMREVNFSGAILQNAVFDGADLTGSWFRDAKLLNASIQRANARAVRFDGANLRGVNFWETRLSHSTFVDTDITDANFDGAILNGVSFAQARGTPKNLDKAIGYTNNGNSQGIRR